MSKVYSFRLNINNPREALAREVIEAWVEEGFSLRHVVVEALLSYKIHDVWQRDINSIIEKLQDLIISFDRSETLQLSETSLSNSFLVAVKQSVKSGLSAK